MLVLLLVSTMAVSRVATTPVTNGNVWLSPIGSLTPLRQFHMQDGSGGYRYSFTGPHHAKAESSLNGITRGGYSYIDANGMLQTVTYTADDENGFRVSASNLPQPASGEEAAHDSPEVAAAKKTHLDELHAARTRDPANYRPNVLSYKILPSYYSFAHLRDEESSDASRLSARDAETTKNPFILSAMEAGRIEVPKPDPSLSKIPSASSSPATPTSLQPDTNFLDNAGTMRPGGSQLGKLVPLSSVQRPIAVPAAASYVLPVVPYRFLHSSLHHMQDSLGQYDYSYTGDSSAKTESRSLDGTTRGAYSYIDANGILQQVHYVADHNGFRVLATNLPEAK